MKFVQKFARFQVCYFPN